MTTLIRPVGAGPWSRAGRGRRGSRPGGDRGAAAVEMALVLPVLLALVFAIIDFGRAYHTQVRVDEAARQGVRTVVLTQEGDPQAAAEEIMSDALGKLATVSEKSAQPCDGPGGTATAVARYEFKGTLFTKILTGRAVMQCPG